MDAKANTTSASLPYLELLAAATPTPGGGSACAVGAALASSLLEMVAGVSVASAEQAQLKQLQHLTEQARTMRLRFVELGSQDETAYGGYREALAMPKITTDEKAARRAALQKATIASARAPLAIATLIVEGINRIPDIAAVASPYLRSDLATAAHLFAGSGHGAIVMVDTNLPSIKDNAINHDLTARRNQLSTAIADSLTTALESLHSSRGA